MFTPTLTGLGERADVPAESVTLTSHVDDVVHAIESEDLRNVVLCAASYGGMPVTVAAARLSDRLAKLVYLDALVPRDGESAADLLPAWFTEIVQAGLAAEGQGFRVAVPEAVIPPVGSAPEPVRQAIRRPPGGPTGADLHRAGQGGVARCPDDLRALHRLHPG